MNMWIFVIPAALLALSVVLCVRMVKKGASGKKAFLAHLLCLVLIVAITVMLPFGAVAEETDDAVLTTGQTEDVAAAAAPTTDNSGLKAIGAALAVGMAGIGGGVAVAAGAPAAIGATAEDPKSFGKSIVFVALGEGFGLYGLLVAIMILVL